MKTSKLLLVLILLAFSSSTFGQWTNKTMTFGGLTRSYRIYVSPNYDDLVPASIVMALHGLGDNMTNFSNLGFAQIGDTANIIVLVPQAVSDPFAGTAWNSGAGYDLGGGSVYYPNASVNDIGFLNMLIDSTLTNYAVDPQRVYLCGFSMGGFMTYRMALQSNARFAAFASMSGTVGAAITTYNPGRHVPIAHWHGTADSTVYFTGNQFGLDADSVVSLWAHLNQCNPIPDTTHIPNNNPGDSITVDMYRFHGLIPEDEVRFYIMNGATHTVLFQPSNDITEPYEIWMFFRNYRWLQAGISDATMEDNNIQFFPNPAVDNISLISNGNGILEIMDLTGKRMQHTIITETSQIIDVQGLSAGMYLMKFTSGNSCSVQKLIMR